MPENTPEKYSEIKNKIGFYGTSPEIEDILSLIATVAPTESIGADYW